MYEHPNGKEYPRWTLEDTADAFLATGDFRSARLTLDEFSTHYCDSDSFLYANLKLFALPLYELAHLTSSEERIRAANDTYGSIASLIDLELTTRNNYPAESEEKRRRIGRLSALTIFGLLVRDGIGDSIAAVPIPASRQEDMHSGIDFYLSPIGTGKIDDGWAIQVKTSPTRADRKRYSKANIVLLGMNEIDEHAGNPNDTDSLAQCILRELDGTHTTEDYVRLTQATATLYEKIINSKKIDSSIERQRIITRIARKVLSPVAI